MTKPIRVDDHSVQRFAERWCPMDEIWTAEVRLKLLLSSLEYESREDQWETWSLTFKNGRTMRVSVDDEGTVRTVHMPDATKRTYRPHKGGKRKR